MTEWRLLCVDDNEEIIADIKTLEERVLPESGDQLQIEALTDFDSALSKLESGRFDLLILDVRLDLEDTEIDDQGRRTLEQIREKRFIPVIFYTGVPHIVRDLETPLVKVLEKDVGLRRLFEVIDQIFRTRIPSVNRSLIQHMENVQRDYMWNFVVNYWEQISNASNHTDLAYLLARRLGLSLTGSGIHNLAIELGDITDRDLAENTVHPMRYYIIPPIEPSPMAGDIYKEINAGEEKYWVVLTPSCDLVLNKAEQILLAHCDKLENQPEYLRWRENGNSGKLKSLLENNRKETGYQADRYYYFPEAFNLPNLVVDFQKLITKSREQLAAPEIERLASLDSPFAEALMSRFIRYFGRLGTPNLDIDLLLQKLENIKV